MRQFQDRTDDTRTNRLVMLLGMLCAALLSIKYFPGVEGNAYYAGFVLKSLYPDLMTQDPIVGNALSSTSSPYKLTLYYLLPKIFGELWLDDRFTAPFYILVVAASFFAADRIAVAFGLRGAWGRVIVQLMFLRDHMIMENAVNFAHQPDFHHSAVVFPIGLWLFWAVIREKSLAVILVIGALLGAVSPQVAPYALGMSLAAVGLTRNGRERTISLALLALGMVAAVYLFGFHLAVPEADRLHIWELLVYHWYEGMVLPFDDRYMGTAFVASGVMIFSGIIGIVLFWPTEKTPALAAARVILTVAFVAWVLMGLYVQFAPEAWRYPQLLLFPITRQMQFPQVLAYVGVTVLMLNWLRDGPSLLRAGVSGLVLFVLVVAGPGNLDLWSGLLGGGLILSLLGHVYWKRSAGLSVQERVADDFRSLFGVAMFLAMGVAMGVSSWQKWPDWEYQFKTGIHGSSSSAPWVEASKWIRHNTPKQAVVLPIEFATDPSSQSLMIRRAIISRGGRATPQPMMLSHGLNLKHFLFAEEQRAIARTLMDSWFQMSPMDIAGQIARLEPTPDYILAPASVVEHMNDPAFPYAPVAEVGAFTVLRMRDQISEGK
ncbi:hypothetical protein JCM17960_14070 [Magnetospira thiophila]